MTNYEFSFSEVRSSIENGKRYARVRAIANGPDSYNSIFTKKAREQIIQQIKSNGVKSRGTHTFDVIGNVETFLKNNMDKFAGESLNQVKTIIGSLPITNYPIGKVVDAQFVDDNIIEALIEENVLLRDMGSEYAKYLDANWKMVEDKYLTGVSVVFDNVKSFEQDGKLFIDDINLRGIDFVDRPSHPSTRVTEVFMRAALESNHTHKEKPVEKQEDKKMTEAKVENVDKIVEDAVRTTLEKEKAQREAELARQKEQEKVKEQLKELEETKAKLKQEQEEKAEALALAKEAVEKAKKTVVREENPVLDNIQKSESKPVDPLATKSLSELLAEKAKLIE